ncbi:MAG: hypothetical protein AAFW73_02495 [Bacteroidota bacterium]
MKKLSILLLLPLLIGSCKDDRELGPILFELTHQVDFEIPAGLNTIEDHFFVFQDRLSNFEAQLDLSGFRREDISRIDPQELRLTAIFAGEEYDFIREVSLDLFVNEANGRRSEAFWRNEIPFNTRGILQIPGTLIDAKDFFLDDERFNMELRLDTREFNDTFIGTRLEVTFLVRGN